MHCSETRRTSWINAAGWSAEFKAEADSSWNECSISSCDEMGIDILWCVCFQVVIACSPTEYSNTIGFGRRCAARDHAGLFHCFIRGHQDNSLCWIDLRCFFRGDAKEPGIESTDILKEAAPWHITSVPFSACITVRSDIPTFEWYRSDSINTMA